jgi:small-conductance mechanosensitive channel
LVATSGVVAIILGLALQNTLSDVFSGIALTLGRPYVIGDGSFSEMGPRAASSKAPGARPMF